MDRDDAKLMKALDLAHAIELFLKTPPDSLSIELTISNMKRAVGEYREAPAPVGQETRERLRRADGMAEIVELFLETPPESMGMSRSLLNLEHAAGAFRRPVHA